MGVILEDESKYIEEIRSLSQGARMVMRHHLCNSLQAILTEAQIERLKFTEGCVFHILEDLDRFGMGKDSF